jgi:hypothetical protein
MRVDIHKISRAVNTGLIPNNYFILHFADALQGIARN